MTAFDMGKVPPVTFGAGRRAELPEIAASLGGGPVLVVADQFLAELGVTDRIAGFLVKAGLGCELAAVVYGEPKEPLIDDLCHRARSAGVKTVVGIGGGAAMDASKLVAAIAPSNTSTAQYALSANPFPKVGLPAIAIPTTAGTGSEVTRTSIVSTSDGTKNWYWGEELMFDHAILDPELTVSLPPHLTAWTGIDAVAHALEAATAKSTNAAGLLYGHEALRILSEWLPVAVAEGSNVEARGYVLWASTVAGLALHNCNTHMGHNISHALGSLSRIHHGHATGLALEVTLPWLVDRPEGAVLYAKSAEALGGKKDAAALPDVYAGLMRACGIPLELPEPCEGVSQEMLATSMKSAANHSMSQNAACDVSDADLDRFAGWMTDLPIVRAA
ncbi:MAG: iron-containing alcohol dehydrogenase [Pseudomonadota bacterium]